MGKKRRRLKEIPKNDYWPWAAFTPRNRKRIEPESAFGDELVAVMYSNKDRTAVISIVLISSFDERCWFGYCMERKQFCVINFDWEPETEDEI